MGKKDEWRKGVRQRNTFCLSGIMRSRRGRKVRAQLEASGTEAMLVSSPENIRYYTGFTGSEALLLLTKREVVLIVDGRYTSQAKGECAGIAIVESRNKKEGVAKCVRELGIRKMGFEPDYVTVAQHRDLERMVDADLVPEQSSAGRVRLIKDKKEIALIEKSARISSQSFLEVAGEIKAGRKEREVALLLEFRMKAKGADAVPFPLMVASGKRGALPHGLSTDKIIRKGEFVTIDFGAVYHGYCSDETCTLVVGKPTRRQKKVYRAVKEAHDSAIDKVGPGVRANQIDLTARELLEKAGLGKYFRHGTGHGVGLAVHEEPVIAHDRKERIEEGMVFTIEPGVYIPGWGGVRIEDMVKVNRQGCELMSSAPKELISV